MTATVPEAQPDGIDMLSQRVDVLALEMRAGFAEMRAGFAETRMGFVELETKLGGRIAAVDAKVETVIDALADFRREYQEHTHE